MCRHGDISLEAEAKGKLHRARAADLEDGTHLAQDVARAESVSKRFVGGAKARTGRESQPPGMGVRHESGTYAARRDSQ
jgi:hypothetical protein